MYEIIFIQIIVLLEKRLCGGVSYEDLTEKKINRIDKLENSLREIHCRLEKVCVFFFFLVSIRFYLFYFFC
jgi:hypothetical protein